MFSPEEESLYAAVRSGNEKAFESFFKKYQPRLFAFSYGILENEAAAKDVVQESFIAFYENRAFIRSDYSVVSYLFKITHGKCCQYVRQNSVKSNFSDLSALELNEIELAYYSEEKNAVNSIYQREIEEAYEKAIDKLPKQSKVIFRMNQKKEMRSKDIAEELSLSLRTVENHLYRATKFIREEMKQYASLFMSFLC